MTGTSPYVSASWSGRARALFLILLGLPAGVSAQNPPDSARVDSLAVVPSGIDSLGIQELPDSLADDSLTVVPFVVRPIPDLPNPLPVGVQTGIWEWNREQLIGSRALTLLELIEEVPGVIAIRGGDFGTPRTITTFGLGGGGVRMFSDGFEMFPLEGSVPDLSRVGLAGLDRVRVVRRGTGLRIEIWSQQALEARPYSLIETGTGDLDTNFFRGTFAHPNALGGSVGLALDRVDTEGPARQETGDQTGAWLRYSRHLGERLSLTGELRTMGSTRDTLFFPLQLRRTDRTIRGRFQVDSGLVAEAFAGRSSLSAEEDEGVEESAFPHLERGQVGLRAALDRGAYWGTASLRRTGGEGVALNYLDVSAGLRSHRFGGIEAEWQSQDWEEHTASVWRGRGWTERWRGFSLFADFEDGEFGVPFVGALEVRRAQEAVEDTMPADSTSMDGAGGEGPDSVEVALSPLFSDRQTSRLGVALDWGGLGLSLARTQLKTDSLRPLGLPLDLDGLTLAGGKRRGGEFTARLPLGGGFALVGSYGWWDDPDPLPTEPDTTDVGDMGEGGQMDGTGEEVDTLPEPPVGIPAGPPWRYLPDHTWKGAITFHSKFLPTENLELWGDIGVMGRDPMRLPLETVGEDGLPVAVDVPFNQSWYFRIQVRVVSLRIFIRWENFTVREENRDFPNRTLPKSRVMYGIRWTLWN